MLFRERYKNCSKFGNPCVVVFHDAENKQSRSFSYAVGLVSIITTDLSKAFDAVNLKILLQKLFEKLESHDIREVAKCWLQSYFENRQQLCA